MDPERVALVTVRLLDDEGSVLDSVVLNRRADGVTSCLRDSLGIPLLNAEWPDTVPCPIYSTSMVDPAMWKRGNLPNDALRTDIEPVVEYRPQMREVFLLIGTRKEMVLWLKE